MNPKPHNYLKQIFEMHASGTLWSGTYPPGPGVSHVTVSHDDWCMIFAGGACNCEPDIKPGTNQPNRAQRRAKKRP